VVLGSRRGWRSVRPDHLVREQQEEDYPGDVAPEPQRRWAGAGSGAVGWSRERGGGLQQGAGRWAAAGSGAVKFMKRASTNASRKSRMFSAILIASHGNLI